MKFTFHFVLKYLPRTFFFFTGSILFGFLVGYLLFNFNKNLFEGIINLWSGRILIGFNLFGPLWFMLNNLIAISLIILAFMLIVYIYFKTSKSRLREQHSKITLFGLHIIPFGALFINGFFTSLFSAYILLNYGIEKFAIAFLFQYPHGINEMIALLFATSLSLAYIEVIRPFVLKNDWKNCVEKGKELILSKTTLLFVILILALIIFSGLLEGILASKLF